MYYLALATDYDGTLATDGRVDGETRAALERLRESGRRLIMVTGRELDDLERVFPHFELFDSIVAENGALLYRPAEREEVPLGPPPPPRFAELLRARGVDPLSVGRVIVATWEPNETTVLHAIRELGLELEIIFNKGAVMVLPSGINKATGLAAALRDMGLSPHNVVGVGDAENDHAFLRLCGCGVAVANALPVLKEEVELVTEGARSAGVRELIDRLLADDLGSLALRAERHRVLLGVGRDGREVWLSPRSAGVLLAGTSGSGKSTLTTGLLERLGEQGYQFCIIDPEGDYQGFEGAVAAGDAKQPPSAEQALQLLERPDQNVAVNMLAIPLGDRPAFFGELLARLQQLRTRTGRPHWIVVDEAHHMLPRDWRPAPSALPREIDGLVLVTVHPDSVSPAALAAVDTVIALGQSPDRTVRSFCERAMREAPPVPCQDLGPGEALMWDCRAGAEPLCFEVAGPRGERRRHVRKYAEGELGEDASFYFRGPENRLNLRAHNLHLFVQIGAGVDDDTWLHHLRAGDYSRWCRESIKDEELA
ncbi:MAG TPA: HAD-IIB family hydrolase, partial [Geminicoccaceae bacterium]|nr:HAD-IIB family hydrolase [Geminicoccaceae bacterium]